MLPKKSKNADLEKRRFMHLEVGFVVILSITLVCFEWGKPGDKDDQIYVSSFIPTEIIESVLRTPPAEKKSEPVRPPIQPVIEIIPDIEPEDLLVLVNIEDPNLNSLLNNILSTINVEEEGEVGDPIPVDGVEIKPLFPGGNELLLPWIYKNIKYPEECAANGIKGTVYATFVVSETGKVKDVSIIKGVYPDIDKEVIRVLSMLPDFRPAVQNGRYVPVRYSIPVKFKLM